MHASKGHRLTPIRTYMYAEICALPTPSHWHDRPTVFYHSIHITQYTNTRDRMGKSNHCIRVRIIYIHICDIIYTIRVLCLIHSRYVWWMGARVGFDRDIHKCVCCYCCVVYRGMRHVLDEVEWKLNPSRPIPCTHTLYGALDVNEWQRSGSSIKNPISISDTTNQMFKIMAKVAMLNTPIYRWRTEQMSLAFSVLRFWRQALLSSMSDNAPQTLSRRKKAGSTAWNSIRQCQPFSNHSWSFPNSVGLSPDVLKTSSWRKSNIHSHSSNGWCILSG